MPGLFVYAAGATISARDRYAAFCTLAESIEHTLRRRLPQLDTPEQRFVSDDIAEALLDELYESVEDES